MIKVLGLTSVSFAYAKYNENTTKTKPKQAIKACIRIVNENLNNTEVSYYLGKAYKNHHDDDYIMSVMLS